MRLPLFTAPRVRCRVRLPRAGWVLVVALLATVPCVRAADTPAQAVSRAANPRRTPIVEVVERVKDSVVNIHSERAVTPAGAEEIYSAMPSNPNRVNGMGTGIVIDPRGYIITNFHVIDDVQVIRVRLSDGTNYSGRILARDQENDLALIKIDPRKPLPTLPIGTASDLMIGETVLAIGNAFGYEHTVTKGIVSALKRDVTLNKEISYKSLIQTDTPINPGNSGGPLVNIHGELIGVNVAIRAGAQNIAFAIPVDTMIRVASDLISNRARNGITHGIKVVDRLEPNTAGIQRSVMIDRIDANGPGLSAGLQRGDVVVSVADQPVGSSLDFERAMLDRPAGEAVALMVRRDGKDLPVNLVLQAMEKKPALPNDVVWKKLGLRLQPAVSDAVTRVNNQLHGGLVVMDVMNEGTAGRAGIQRGDILIGLHQWETLTLDNVQYVLNHPDLSSFNPLRFFIIREGQVRRGWLPRVD